MLAACDDEFIEAYIESAGLPSETALTLTDPEALRAEVETIRANGYARNRRERERDIQAVSAAA
jgi:DNA-binding IclR family transcriptional regulator